jgi:hypothetical protein
VRLAHDGTNNVILLGNTGTIWQYPKIVVTSVMAGFSNQTGWETGWSGALITDETGITNIVSPAIPMYINSAGNIGIGTTAPTAKLEVAGQVKITGGVPGVGKVLTSDASGLASWTNVAYTESDPQVGANTTNYVSKWNGSSLVTSQLFDNGMNVGIGTSTPGAPLEISSTNDGIFRLKQQ